MAEELNININLDSASVKKQLDEISEVAQESATEFESNIGEDVANDLKSVNVQIKNINEDTNLLRSSLQSSSSAFLILSGFIGNFADEFSKLFAGLSAQFLGFNKGIFGLSIGLSAASGGFEILSQALKNTDSDFAKVLSTIAKIAGFITGGFSFALTLAIVKIGEFAREIGTNLVTQFEKAADIFAKFERQSVLFVKTIENFNTVTSGAVGSTEAWTEEINDLSNALNLSVNSLQKASTEIVTVGSRLGLQEDQLRTLNRVVAEYAKLSGKDVFDSSVAFVSALNGQSQAVLSYGVKLTESSNQQFLLKKGIDESFRSLSDAEKVQVRFNNLLSQYSDIAGIAASTSDTLAEQQERLAVNIEAFNAKLGEGAAIIENNNILAFTFNRILNNLNDGIIKATGFFGAFGARVLQIGGFLLEFSFQILAVTKGIQLLNLVLNTNIAQSLLFIRLPLINQSLINLLGNLSKTQVSIKSFSDILKVIGRISFVTLLDLPKTLLSIGRASAVALVPFLPLIAKIGATAFVINQLIDAFKAIEERTRVFSTVAQVFGDNIKNALDFSLITNGIRSLSDLIKKFVDKTLGFLVVSLSLVFEGFARLVTLNPFGVFSDENINKIKTVADNLKGLREQLVETNFSLDQLGSTSSASLDAVNDGAKVKSEELIITFINTFSVLGGIIAEGFSNFSSRLNEIINFSKEQSQELATIVGNTFSRSITSTIQNIVKAVETGKNAFEALGKGLINLAADLAISIGQFVVALGVAKLAAESLPGGATIAAGLGLIAIGSILKAISGSGFAGGDVSGGGAGGGILPTGGPEFQEETFEDQRERETAITVNVEGTVLDPVAVGEQIAQILDETANAGASTIQVSSA